MTDVVRDEEVLFRRARKGHYEHIAGVYRISETAFDDRARRPSVDRSELIGGDPERSRWEPTDLICWLRAGAVRELVVADLNSGAPHISYEIEVSPEPIIGAIHPLTGQLYDNSSHAEIHGEPPLSKKVFKELKEMLADMAKMTLKPDE